MSAFPHITCPQAEHRFKPRNKLIFGLIVFQVTAILMDASIKREEANDFILLSTTIIFWELVHFLRRTRSRRA